MMLSLLAMAAHAQDGAVFGTWEVACDNTRACAAFGLDEESGAAFLRVARGPGAADGPVLTVGLYADGVGSAATLTTRGGARGATLSVPFDAPGGGGDMARGSASGADAARFVAALADAAEVEVWAGGSSQVVSLAGSSAALRWMDDRQKRAGTTSALVARGPATIVPPAPAAPVVRRAPPASQEGLPKALPEAVARAAAEHECGADPISADFPPEASRLAPGVILWGVACWAGAYNVGTRHWLAAEDGTNVRPAKIPTAEDDILVNAGFDAAASRLWSFSKGRGLGDCGTSTSWVWDGAAFQLAHRAELRTCAALLSDVWPTLYRADVR